jgi:hypothetical protein
MVHGSDYVTRLQNRAQVRMIAEGVSDPKNREDLLKWAEEYDRGLRGLLRARENIR